MNKPQRKLTSTPHNLVHLHRDRGYRFRDRDPDILWICNTISDSGISTKEISQRVAELSKGASTISPQTIDYWLNGTTRRPQNFTLTWVAAALGYERKWTKI